MHQEGIKEKTDSGGAQAMWAPRRETAPSTIVAVQPVIPRIAGSVGLVFLVLGGLTIFLYIRTPTTARLISQGWAWILAALGLGGVIYHALVDEDIQVRRLYQVLGYALILVAIFLTWIPHNDVFGAYFVPWGVMAYMLGFVVLLSFLRHETEPQLRDYAIYTIGIVAAGMALAAFALSSFSWVVKVVAFILPWSAASPDRFLLSHGFILALLGLMYGTAFIVLRPKDDQLSLRAGLAMGIGGAFFFLIALYRSYIVKLMISWKWMEAGPDYVMPSGLLLMGLGLLYVCAALLLCAEYPLIVMVRRELTRYFCTPIAYIVLLACVGLSWLLFYVFVEVLNNVARGGEAFREPIVGQYLFGTLAFLPVVSLMIIVPLVTMGVLSEERRTGTMEMLLTVQLSEASIVISKFIAALVLFMVFWLPWAGYLVSLRIFDEQFFDYRPLLSFYIAIFCMGFNFVAMGLFFSSLTQNQLTAGILSFLAMMLLVVCYFLEGMNKGKLLGDIFEHSSFIDLWSDAAQGKLALRRLIYHLSAGIFWLVLSVKVLEVRRWK